MELKQHKEYQTIRLFAILGVMTAMVVLLLKVVLFAPQASEANRQPAQNVNLVEKQLNNQPIVPAETDKK